MFTLDELKQAMPVQIKNSVSPELLAVVNNISKDPEFARTIRENIISYTGILKDGKFKIEDYIRAVAYVSYKLMGHSNKESYKKTFPHRYQALTSAGRTEKEISAYVAAYNKNKLVNLILEQTLVPMWVLNQDAYQEAINTQVMLMTTAKSEMVRMNAANSLLTHLKKPEKQEVELDIGIKETSGMRELKDMLHDLATKQRELIQEGVPTREIAQQKIINMEAEDAEVIPDPLIES